MSRDLLGPSLRLSIGKAVAFAVTFCVPLVLVRVFDTAQFGAYKQLFLVQATLFAVGQIGMAESLFYFLPQSPQAAGRFAANSMIALGAAGAAFALLLVAAARPVAALLGNPAIAGHLPLIGLFLVWLLPSTPLEIVLIARARYVGAAAIYGASEVIKAAAFVVPVLLAPSLVTLLVGACVFALARLVFCVLLFRSTFGAEFRPDRDLLRRQAAYAVPFAAAVIVQVLQLRWHEYAVSHSFDAATFAIYSVGCLQIPLVEFFASPLCNVMMVRMREQLESGRSGEALALWHEVTAKISHFALPITGLLVVCAQPLIVFLFTADYAASVPVFVIWTLTLALAVFQTDGVLRVFAATRVLLLIYLLHLALVLLTIPWMLGTLGLPGAALSVVLATVVAKAVALQRISRLLGVAPRALLPWGALARVGGSAAAATAVGWLGGAAIELDPFGALVLRGTLFSVCYFALLLRVHPPLRGAVGRMLRIPTGDMGYSGEGRTE